MEQGTYLPIKAGFYSDSGRLLKIAYYRGFTRILGTTRPTQTVIIDAVDKSLATVTTSADYAGVARRGDLPVAAPPSGHLESRIPPRSGRLHLTGLESLVADRQRGGRGACDRG